MNSLFKGIIVLVLCLIVVLLVLLQILPYLTATVSTGPIAGLVALLFFGFLFYGIYKLVSRAMK